MSSEFSTSRRFGEPQSTGVHDASGAVQEYAVPTALVAFGVGLGVGIWLSGMFASPPARQQRMSEKLGRQLIDTLASILPESVARRM
jgi:hypothetical protein